MGAAGGGAGTGHAVPLDKVIQFAKKVIIPKMNVRVDAHEITFLRGRFRRHPIIRSEWILCTTTHL
jgi:hypothetical protein